MKKCARCAEDIQEAARVCCHCSFVFNPLRRPLFSVSAVLLLGILLGGLRYVSEAIMAAQLSENLAVETELQEASTMERRFTHRGAPSAPAAQSTASLPVAWSVSRAPETDSSRNGAELARLPALLLSQDETVDARIEELTSGLRAGTVKLSKAIDNWTEMKAETEQCRERAKEMRGTRLAAAGRAMEMLLEVQSERLDELIAAGRIEQTSGIGAASAAWAREVGTFRRHQEMAGAFRRALRR